MYAYQHLLIFPTAIDVTPTGFKDLADVFLQRCHPYGVQETFAESICRDLQQIPRNVPKLTPMGAVRSTQPTANSFLKLTAMRGVAYEPMSYIELTLP